MSYENSKIHVENLEEEIRRKDNMINFYIDVWKR